VLHLFEHVPRGDDEDPLTPAAPHQLGQDHPDLEGLAQADGVGEQDPRPQRVGVEGLLDGGALVVEGVGEHRAGDGEVVVIDGQRRLAERGLEPEPGALVIAGVVGDDLGLARVERRDGVEAGVELRRRPRDELTEPLTRDQRAVLRLRHLRDDPLLVTHDDERPRRDALDCQLPGFPLHPVILTRARAERLSSNGIELVGHRALSRRNRARCTADLAPCQTARDPR